MGSGPLFYIFLGFRYYQYQSTSECPLCSCLVTPLPSLNSTTPNNVKRRGPYIISRIFVSGPETWELDSQAPRFYIFCAVGDFPDLLYHNGRTYLLCEVFVHAPCFQQIVSACECKQRASNVPAEQDKRKNKFETSSSNFNGIFTGGGKQP